MGGYGFDDLGYDSAVIPNTAYHRRLAIAPSLHFEHLATGHVADFGVGQVGMYEGFVDAETAFWMDTVDDCVVEVCRVRAFSEEDGHVFEMRYGGVCLGVTLQGFMDVGELGNGCDDCWEIEFRVVG